MTYPFVEFPTLSEFINWVTSKYKVTITKPKGILSGPRGKTELRVFIRNSKDGKKWIAVVPDLKDNDVLTPNVLRTLCIQLNIECKDVGLMLG